MGETLATARMNRMEFLEAAAKGDCVCKSRWITAVTSSFIANGINVGDLCTDVYTALRDGRVETTPVLVMAGERGGEGKSMLFKALAQVFGDEYVFHTPEPGRFPLIDLVGMKIAFLDDWRFDEKLFCHSLLSVGAMMAASSRFPSLRIAKGKQGNSHTRVTLQSL